MALQQLVIILNGVSRKKKLFYHTILPGIRQAFNTDVWETEYANHAIELAKKATLEGATSIFAAGGDGTLNQVLNGILLAGVETMPTLGIIPLGTGNDFARVANIRPNAESVLEKLKSGGQWVDVGLVQGVDEQQTACTRYFINVASLGLGPAVVHRLAKSNRSLGPALTYLKAILSAFFTAPQHHLEITTQHWQWIGRCRVFAMANSRSFGSGIYVAPDASVQDGELNTFVAGAIPLGSFLLALQTAKAGKKISHPKIEYNKAASLTLKSTEQVWLETEGELAALLPATVMVLPSKIRFYR